MPGRRSTRGTSGDGAAPAESKRWTLTKIVAAALIGAIATGAVGLVVYVLQKKYVDRPENRAMTRAEVHQQLHIRADVGLPDVISDLLEFMDRRGNIIQEGWNSVLKDAGVSGFRVVENDVFRVLRNRLSGAGPASADRVRHFAVFANLSSYDVTVDSVRYYNGRVDSPRTVVGKQIGLLVPSETRHGQEPASRCLYPRSLFLSYQSPSGRDTLIVSFAEPPTDDTPGTVEVSENGVPFVVVPYRIPDAVVCESDTQTATAATDGGGDKQRIDGRGRRQGGATTLKKFGKTVAQRTER